MREYKITNLDQIPNFAKTISKTLKGGQTYALIGTLGAGKTTFVKELGKQLKIKDKITSPTFVLMHRHLCSIKKQKIFLYHLDLYRTKSFREVKYLGLEEFWGKKNSITLIEWADKIKRHWPRNIVVIKFNN